jgi:hypothetical protein
MKILRPGREGRDDKHKEFPKWVYDSSKWALDNSHRASLLLTSNYSRDEHLFLMFTMTILHVWRNENDAMKRILDLQALPTGEASISFDSTSSVGCFVGDPFDSNCSVQCGTTPLNMLA